MDINTKDADGNTPLHLAVGRQSANYKNSQLSIVQILLDHGASLNLKNNEGNPPLHHAVLHYNGDIGPIRYILKRHGPIGDDLTIMLPYLNAEQQTFMQLVKFKRKSLKLIRQLFKRNFYIGIKKGDFALFKAVQELDSSSKIVKLLLKNRLKVRGKTLLEAVQNPSCKSKIIKLLLEKFENLEEAITENGYTPLHFAVSNLNCKSKIVKMLVNAGADVNATTTLRLLSPLHLAVSNKKCPLKVIKFLLRRGSNINARCAQGFSPAEYAAKKGATAVLNILQKKILDEAALLASLLEAAQKVSGHSAE